MKIRVIRERTEALSTIAGRALPSATAENKVSFLLQQRFQRLYDVTEKRRQKEVIEAFPAPDGVSSSDLPAALQEARQIAADRMLDEDLVVKKIPEQMRLTAADMPKALKGDDGWRNAVGIAALRKLLGGLYQPTGAEIVKDEEVGEEPDELPLEPENPMEAHTAGSE